MIISRQLPSSIKARKDENVLPYIVFFIDCQKSDSTMILLIF